MNSIIYVGMDVHTSNFTLCAFSPERNHSFAIVQTDPDVRFILKYINKIQKIIGHPCSFVCGYEAGYLGFDIFHKLQSLNIDCVILAPSTIPSAPHELKTDRRDALKIAKALAFNTYKPVHVPSEEDNAVSEYIRMRDDHKDTLKRIKQQILAFCSRHGKTFDGKSNWTRKHFDWLRSLDFNNDILNETFREYFTLLLQAIDKIDLFDRKIQELAHSDSYRDNVKKLSCFIGIREHTALALLAEVSDFSRFPSAQNFSSFLGLVPSEHSSGNKNSKGSITKAGNKHLRMLLTEAAKCYTRGNFGKKSKALLDRQHGNSPQIIAYADKANERLKRKYHNLKFRTHYNVAVTAVARELACFVWGMMNNQID